MRVIRRIINPDGSALVDPEYPVHYMEPGSEARIGFEKGTLQKARFDLRNDHVIEYERRPED